MDMFEINRNEPFYIKKYDAVRENVMNGYGILEICCCGGDDT